MFNNLLAKMGVGGAKVDLVLESNQWSIGETIRGHVNIQGGSAEQFINKIDVEFKMKYTTGEFEYMKSINLIPVVFNTTIGVREHKQIPFETVIPLNVPISKYNVSYFFHTHLDISGAVDAYDNDYVQVTPNADMDNVFHALHQIGFHEKQSFGKYDGNKQEFEFYPPHNYSNVEELEIVLETIPTGIKLQLELDMKGYSRETELRQSIFIPTQTLQNYDELKALLESKINEMISHYPVHQNHHHPMQHQPHSQPGHSHYGHHESHGHHHHEHHENHGHNNGHSNSNMMMGIAGGFVAGIVADEIFEEIFDNGDEENDDNED
ncbi:sporulation protein [Bacillus thuringiensis]|uniref:sporulation protein n=1 Tax=Bacillus thuringiensis TaxID=1428 RepID=UPI0021D65813|nr:sporulation protein [Bacillus thuringiensis]MCU7667836.1 sporulation protein [Bacillus thuringiensis]